VRYPPAQQGKRLELKLTQLIKQPIFSIKSRKIKLQHKKKRLINS
jgi:hypothetical protein